MEHIFPKWEQDLYDEAVIRFGAKPTAESGRWVKKEYKKRRRRAKFKEFIQKLK